MKKESQENLSSLERKISVLGGGALILDALFRPSWAKILEAGLGVFLVHRGLTGSCPVKKQLSGLPEEAATAPSPEPVEIKEETESETPPEAEVESEYERMSYTRLYQEARKRGIPGRSAMNKAQLIDALKKSE
ncbi:MAG: hypothetical protein Kow0037_21620 [Calditrichia bacterium]